MDSQPIHNARLRLRTLDLIIVLYLSAFQWLLGPLILGCKSVDKLGLSWIYLKSEAMEIMGFAESITSLMDLRAIGDDS